MSKVMISVQVKRAAALVPGDVILGIAYNGEHVINPTAAPLRVMGSSMFAGMGMVDLCVLPMGDGHLEWVCRKPNTPVWIQ